MTNRLNDTDLRLLRHSVNEKKPKDQENGDESLATNQEFSYKCQDCGNKDAKIVITDLDKKGGNGKGKGENK